ncbi:hypothetical protein [Nocardiopsis sp. YSL2]|uniref:TPR repeat region-containing protein n=1 Tax=Nocardiopsis sp. YSL2 TaxID=2939492 RepID=UPI0026F42197|nr:hypothetical protein [Nocardiopsis sp. YSL2]
MAEGSYQISPKECGVSVAELQNQAQVFDEMYSNICGRSARYNDVANTTATEFSDLIEDDISEIADENEEAWSSALLATIHAVGVIKAYAEAVRTYKNTIENLEGDLANDIAAADTKSEKENLVEEYQGLADTAWRKLEAEASAVDDMLSDGPTPEHISALTEAGHIGGPPGGLGWVVTGDDEYFGVTPGMDGSEIGETIQKAAEGDEAALERLQESISLMNAFMAYVAGKQESGTQLTERELEILADLNAHLDDADPSESSDTGVSSYDNPVEEAGEFFTSIEAIKESEHLSVAQKNQLLALIGGTVIASSDENIGGEYSNLPESVRSTVEGPRIHSASTSLNNSYSPDWAGDFELLVEIFDEARESSHKQTGYSIQGGAELSAISIGTVAGAVDSWASSAIDEETLSRILEFATQNEDANYAILTGEYPDGEDYRHPVEFHLPAGQSGTDHEELVSTLFSHDWEGDDGDAVSGITDWIGDFHDNGNDEEQRMAGEAAYSLINMMADSDGENKFKDTGVKDDDEHDMSVGELNPELADSFADIYISYIDDFTIHNGDEGYRALGENEGDIIFHGVGDEVLILPESVKRDFFQLIVANEDVSPKVLAATENQEWRILEEVFTHGNSGAMEGAAASGSLRELMTEAIMDEHISRGGDVESAREQAQKQWEAGYGVFSAAVSGAAGVGSPGGGVAASVTLEMLKSPYSELINQSVKDDIPNIYFVPGLSGDDGSNEMSDYILRDQQEAYNHVTLQMGHVLLEGGAIDEEQLAEAGLLVDYPSGEARLPVTTAEWGAGANSKTEELLDILHAASPDVGANDQVDEYASTFVRNYGPDNLGRSGS